MELDSTAKQQVIYDISSHICLWLCLWTYFRYLAAGHSSPIRKWDFQRSRLGQLSSSVMVLLYLLETLGIYIRSIP